MATEVMSAEIINSQRFMGVPLGCKKHISHSKIAPNVICLSKAVR
jgi:hypothetical protein